MNRTENTMWIAIGIPIGSQMIENRKKNGILRKINWKFVGCLNGNKSKEFQKQGS